MRKQAEQFRETKLSQIGAYRALYTIFDKYEELNLTTYTDGNERKLVIGDPANKEVLKDQMNHMVENLKNPYDEMYHWVKGEMYDIQSLSIAIQGKENIERNQNKMEKKKTNTQSDLEHVNQGKKSIRTIFKSDKDTNGMLNTIEIVSYSRDVII